jgi:hypothetical protein
MRLGSAALGALALLAAGCGPSQPQGRKVTISGNSLLYSATPSSFSGTDRFNWDVTAPTAFIRFDGTQLSAGDVHVTILDNASSVVFEQGFSTKVQPTSGPTRSGTAGQWQVRIEYTQTSGTVQLDGKGAQ